MRTTFGRLLFNRALPDELWDEGVATFNWQTYPELETSAKL